MENEKKFKQIWFLFAVSQNVSILIHHLRRPFLQGFQTFIATRAVHSQLSLKQKEIFYK